MVAAGSTCGVQAVTGPQERQPRPPRTERSCGNSRDRRDRSRGGYSRGSSPAVLKLKGSRHAVGRASSPCLTSLWRPAVSTRASPGRRDHRGPRTAFGSDWSTAAPGPRPRPAGSRLWPRRLIPLRLRLARRQRQPGRGGDRWAERRRGTGARGGAGRRRRQRRRASDPGACPRAAQETSDSDHRSSCVPRILPLSSLLGATSLVGAALHLRPWTRPGTHKGATHPETPNPLQTPGTVRTSQWNCGRVHDFPTPQPAQGVLSRTS
ncbi:serine/arginine repetitive matrix protein 3-like [Saccopteryx bilineata]|uniref:serine/arginine repetitive matrix protein 3-like n=1 Tax=Saccopteryx bilineata TaxID=59482 RepID=UPI00338E4D92